MKRDMLREMKLLILTQQEIGELMLMRKMLIGWGCMLMSILDQEHWFWHLFGEMLQMLVYFMKKCHWSRM